LIGSPGWYKLGSNNRNTAMTAMKLQAVAVASPGSKERRIEDDQNERLLNFAHIVSHNLRSHSRNLSQLLKLLSVSKTQSEQAQLFQCLMKLAASFENTVENLAAVVVCETVDHDTEALNLRNYIERTVDVLKAEIQEYGVRVINHIPSFMTITFVPAYLESILINIMSNSVKYRHANRLPEIVLSVSREKKFTVLQISDNGRGIDLSKYGTKVFGLYQTFHGNKDATGVGLYITKNQIESLGGKIKVESEPDKGSTFSIYFPAKVDRLYHRNMRACEKKSLGHQVAK
jgi:signal transduction histidine kinase